MNKFLRLLTLGSTSLILSCGGTCPGNVDDEGSCQAGTQHRHDRQSDDDGTTESVDRAEKIIFGTVAAATDVRYFLQDIKLENYRLEHTEELALPAGTLLGDIERTYPGFTISGFSQNGTTLNIYYDRNIITVTFDLNGGTATGSQLVFKGIFESALDHPTNPVKKGFDFIGWYDGATRMPAIYPAEDGRFSAKWRERGGAPDGFVLVKGGTVVGSNDYATSGINTCQGVFTKDRTVTLSDFYMAQYEVTKKLYKSIMGDSTLNTLGLSEDPSYTTNNNDYAQNVLVGDDPELLPVDGIYWNDAVYFCNLLSQKEGLEPVYTIADAKIKTAKVGNNSITYLGTATVTIDLTKNGYRLPTEAEWEYAARGGDPASPEFAWGYPTTYSEKYNLNENPVLDAIAWYSYNSNNGEKAQYGKAGYASHQVGRKIPNSLGLYDMAGNVSEFCNDGYPANLKSAPTNDKGTFENPIVTKGPNHLARGGYWGGEGTFQQVSYRQYIPNDNADSFTANFRGFRLVRNK